MLPVTDQRTSVMSYFGNGQDPGRTQRVPASAFFCIDSFDRNQPVDVSGALVGKIQPINNFVIQKGQTFMSGFFNRIGVTEIRFPYGVPNVNARNNNILFEDSAAVVHTITIDEGFYTPVELAAALQAQLVADIAGQTWTVAYTDTTSTFTITSNANFAVYPFPYSNPRRTLKGLFHMLNGQTSLPALTWTTSPMPNMQYTAYVDICSRTLTQMQPTKDNSTRETQSPGLITRLYLNNYSSEGVGDGDTSAVIYWPGCRPALVYRLFNVPKMSAWQPGQFIDQVDIQLYDDVGELLYYGEPGGAQYSNNDFQITFQVSET